MDHTLTTDLQVQRAELRALLTASILRLPDYSLDSPAVRRAGQLLAYASERPFDERQLSRMH